MRTAARATTTSDPSAGVHEWSAAVALIAATTFSCRESAVVGSAFAQTRQLVSARFEHTAHQRQLCGHVAVVLNL